MAFSSTDVETLEAAIASGTKRVSIGGRDIEYRSMDDLISAYNLIKRQVEASSRPRLRRGRYNSAYSDEQWP
jgi:hypothetical protein